MKEKRIDEHTILVVEDSPQIVLPKVEFVTNPGYYTDVASSEVPLFRKPIDRDYYRRTFSK